MAFMPGSGNGCDSSIRDSVRRWPPVSVAPINECSSSRRFVGRSTTAMQRIVPSTR
jgi:hypothetical protein